MVCFLLIRRDNSLGAGVACALAVLIRPNLAPLAIVPLLIARHRLWFSAPVAVAGAFLAAMQWLWYGSPWQSGYGPADDLFALGNIAGNAPRYFSWLITTAPILLVAGFGFWRCRRDRIAQAMFAFAALVAGSYLVYAVFDDWSYLRFLLPGMAVLAVFTAAALSAWIGRCPLHVRAPIGFALALAIASQGIWVARSLDTFKLAAQLRRIAVVADYINADVPATAAIVSGEQSGSMRYYSGRPILRWEAATPEAMAAAVTSLEQMQRPVYIVLDAWESGLFRSKFGALPIGTLDWPPILEAGTSHRTRLWRLADRERFQRGERFDTIRLP
jgi:hypothetical protein